MTVGDTIKRLKQFNKDQEVIVFDTCLGYIHTEKVEKIDFDKELDPEEFEKFGSAIFIT